jgi:hypothetical protein
MSRNTVKIMQQLRSFLRSPPDGLIKYADTCRKDVLLIIAGGTVFSRLKTLE